MRPGTNRPQKDMNGNWDRLSPPLVGLASRLSDRFDLDLPVTAALDYPTLGQGQCDKISHIDTEDDRIDTLISHIISPYPISISRMTMSIW